MKDELRTKLTFVAANYFDYFVEVMEALKLSDPCRWSELYRECQRFGIPYIHREFNPVPRKKYRRTR